MKHLLTITDRDITGTDKLSNRPPRIAVSAILFDESGEIAVTYMSKFSLYSIPGGGVDKGESLQAALHRELREETGCACEIISELGYIINNCAEIDYVHNRYYYIARVVGNKGPLGLTQEELDRGMSIKWMTIEDALAEISRPREEYREKFIQKRDIAAINAAMSAMEDKNFIV